MKHFIFTIVFSLAAVLLPALDLWPEAADKHALFAGAHAASLSFSEGFSVTPPAFYLDYVIPFFLPLSLGAFFKTPDPNLKSFGARLAYHLNIRDSKTDLFFLYVFDFGFLRNDLLLEYGDTPAPLYFYDFRLGVRRRFGAFFCLSLETGFHLEGLHIGLSLKLY